MRASLLLSSIAAMAAIVPATLFAQNVPVPQAVAAPVAIVRSTSTIPTTVPDPKALAARPAIAKAAVKAAVRTTAKRAAVKTTVRRTTVKPTATRKPATTTSTKVAVTSSSSNDLQTAQSVLASLKSTYRYLDGVTVSMGTTPGGYQAVSYYTKGRILISTRHTATISRIMKHEIWHIIDWRDNGKIDWRESVPPRNAADYLK